MIYKVNKQYVGRPETTLKSFKKYEEAVQFVQESLAEDIRFKVQGTTYKIYEFDEVMSEFTQADAAMPASTSAAQSSTAQAGRAQSFSPTPFNTSPIPGGLPRSYIRDVDSDKK